MIKPTFQHAETHDHYKPRVRDPRIVEAERIAQDVRRLKVTDSDAGSNIVDDLVDHLVKQTLAITGQPEHEKEPDHWTAPQRVVWRSSRLSFDRKAEVIEKGSVTNDSVAYAIVNAGRWLVHCPFPGCNGAQYASAHDARFWCVDCDNKAVGGQWIKVLWPDSVDDIEQALLHRPTEAQHWLTGETVQDLVDQNLEQAARQ